MLPALTIILVFAVTKAELNDLQTRDALTDAHLLKVVSATHGKDAPNIVLQGDLRSYEREDIRTESVQPETAHGNSRASGADEVKSIAVGGTRDIESLHSASSAMFAYARRQATTRANTNISRLIEGAADDSRHKRQASDSCGIGWSAKNGLCYKVTEELSWNAARQACNSVNGFLTDISSRNQENDIYDFLNSIGVNRAWIGLNDHQNEGQYQWDSGRAVTYLNWANGEPNDNSGNEDCVEIIARTRSGWNDNVCTASLRGVCQKLVVGVGNQCGSLLRGSGFVRSPGYPGTYQNNINCYFNILAAPEYNTILLQLLSFDTEACCDILTISDNLGQQISLSGVRQPVTITLGTQANMSFITDGSVTRTGFDILFASVNSNNGVGRPCDSLFHDSGFVRSPGFPGGYQNNVKCDFKLHAAPEHDTILLQVRSFDTQECCDRLTISDNLGQQFSFSGVRQPANIALGSHVNMSFSTDHLITRTGFDFFFSSIKSNVGVVRKCGSLFRDSGFVRSPGFPGTYQNNTKCDYKLQAAPDHDTIFLQVRSFDTQECCDILTISDNLGQHLSFSGVRQPANITLGSQVDMSFTTDGSETRTGFDFFFSSKNSNVGDFNQCGYMLRDSGVIRSPGFPESYQNNINCNFSLQAAPDHDFILLQLRRFATEDCCDYLRISDNLGQHLSFSGVHGPQNIMLGSQVTMSFTTNGAQISSGFDFFFSSMKRRDSRLEYVDSCGIGWTSKNGLCYKVTEELSWNSTRQACNSINGFLTDISSRSQENDIYDFLNSIGVRRAWIGLNDHQSEGRYQWDSGRAVTYLNWENGEPKDYSGNEDCVEIFAEYRNGWNDNVCTKSFRGVCQKLDICRSGSWGMPGEWCFAIDLAQIDKQIDGHRACSLTADFMVSLYDDPENDFPIFH